MEKLFLKILDMSIMGSILVAVALLLRILFRRAPKWISCLLWGVVALRLIGPFSLESRFSLIPVKEPVSSVITNEAHVEVLQEEVMWQGDVIVPSQGGVAIPAQGLETPMQPKEAHRTEQAVNGEESTELRNGESTDAKRKVATSARNKNRHLVVLTSLWMAGIFVMLGYALVSYLLLRRKVRGSVKYEKRIRLCDYIDAPFILGIINPHIYIPSGMSGQQMAHALAHEKAHLKRLDHLWKPLGFAVLAVHWFNPLVWVAYIFLCRDIEIACDEKVVRAMEREETMAYAQTLLDFEKEHRTILMCPLAFGEVSVKERIKHVLHYKKPTFWVILVALLCCVIASVCFLTNPKDKKEAAQQETRQQENGEQQEAENEDTEQEGVTSQEGEDFGESFETKYEFLGDLDGNGQEEYVEFYGAEGNYQEFSFFFNEECVYHHEDLLSVDIYGEKTRCLDLDHDGEEELFLVMLPHVNSMPLMEYAVIKNVEGAWEKLEMYQGEDILDNTFPIHVTKTSETTAQISCDGLEEEPIAFTIHSEYDDWKDCSTGDEVASTCAWGIWNIDAGSFEGQPCLVAEQGIQGSDKFDFWGSVYISFDYDHAGKIRILQMVFEQELPEENTEVRVHPFTGELMMDSQSELFNWESPVDEFRVSAGFGEQSNGSYSNHINLAGEIDDRVYAVQTGTVTEIGFDNICGNYLVLSVGDGIYVRYGHLNSIAVSQGDMVDGGAVVGYMGKTGTATGVNLLFAVEVHGVPVNPMNIYYPKET